MVLRKRKGPLEKDIQRAICDWLHAEGYFFWRVNNIPSLGRFGAEGEARFRAMPKYALKGVADLLLLDKGKLYALEVKVPGRPVHPDQIAFGERVNAAGGEYHVVRSLEDAQSIFAHAQ